MRTPLQEKRRRNKQFEILAGVESKYVLPHDESSPHVIALALRFQPWDAPEAEVSE